MIVLIVLIALGALLLCACGAFAFLMLGIDVIRDWSRDPLRDAQASSMRRITRLEHRLDQINRNQPDRKETR